MWNPLTQRTTECLFRRWKKSIRVGAVRRSGFTRPAFRQCAISHVRFAVCAQYVWCFAAALARAPNWPGPPRVLAVKPVVCVGYSAQGCAGWQCMWAIVIVNLPKPAAKCRFLSQFFFCKIAWVFFIKGKVACCFFVKTLRGKILQISLARRQHFRRLTILALPPRSPLLFP